MNHPLLAFLTVPIGVARCASVVIVSSPDLSIPDNNSVGVADFLQVDTPIVEIESIELTLEILGGYNGDYYFYLQHETGFAVLLNRPGRSILSTADVSGLGYPDSGMLIEMSEVGPDGDVHLYREVTNPNGGPLVGRFQPDGRDVDPALSVASISRTATFDSFTGLDPNGTWVLFGSDHSAGGIGTLDSWSLTINGAIPEPSTLGLVMLAATATFLRRRREKEHVPVDWTRR